MPESLSATEQSIFISSVVSKTTLPPDKSSKLEPAGIFTSFAKNDVPLVTLFAPPLLPVSLTNSTSAVTVEVELVSDTGSRGGANNVTNGTSFLAKDVNIPAGSSLELLSGGKVVLETTDEIKIDCSVADKISGTLSIMEIT